MNEHRNHLGRTLLGFLPMAALCFLGWLAEWTGRGAGWLDAACWRGIGRLERWAEVKERTDG